MGWTSRDLKVMLPEPGRKWAKDSYPKTRAGTEILKSPGSQAGAWEPGTDFKLLPASDTNLSLAKSSLPYTKFGHGQAKKGEDMS